MSRTLHDIPNYTKEEHVQFEKIVGDNYTWYVSEDQNASQIYHEREGHSLKINVDGETISVQHANAEALMKDTGINLTENYPTMGFIALEREMIKGTFHFSKIVFEDTDYTLGNINRLRHIAEAMEERPIYVVRKSPDGSSSEWIKE